jgi:succinyldiaminopimelate transaminase
MTVGSLHLSPAMRSVAPYPFEDLDRRKAEALAAGRSLIDFGVGDPREVTAPFIREALAAALEPVSSYPRAAGLPELRDAVCGWVGRRFGVSLDPSRQVLPILGSKEIVFGLAQLVLDAGRGRDLVVVTAPGYPIPERGARWAGGDVLRLPLLAEAGFLPDLDGVAASTWERTALVWLNYPNNPTGAVATPALYARAAELARRHGFLLASDEAYSELWFGDGPPPASVLQVGDLSNVVVVQTLSKRSSMTGYRSGFVAGDPELIAALKRLRPSVGVTPQEFVQRASVAAWNDEAHVEQTRARYGAKRAIFLSMFARAGVEVAGSQATFYLWVRVPGGRPSLTWALELLERGGIIVAPGSFFGPEGEGYVRMAMVPGEDDCRRAAAILAELLSTEVSA